jgi:hypothetical protein
MQYYILRESFVYHFLLLVIKADIKHVDFGNIHNLDWCHARTPYSTASSGR